MPIWDKLFGRSEPPQFQPEPKITGSRVFKRNLPPQEGIVCPFCMERFNIWELEFRSTSVDEEEVNGYAREVDTKYVAFWKNVHRDTQNEEQNFVLHISDRENVMEVRLWDETWIPNTPENQVVIEKKAIWQVRDKFGNISSQRICPYCHNDLPNVIGRSPNYIISMLGNTSSGKTVYLSRLLLSLLKNGFLPDWGLTIDIIYTDPSAPKNRPAIIANLKRMFEGKGSDSEDKKTGKLADATKTTYICPIILKLQKGRQNTLVTLFDFPGEVIWRLKGEEEPFFRTLMNRINENASGWLFLLDSTTLDPVRRFVLLNKDEEYLSQENIDDPTLNADPGSVLLEFSNFFGGGNQIKTPVALVFSKADMIARYAGQLGEAGYQISEDSSFLCDPLHPNRSKVDLDDLWRSDQALQKFLEGDDVLRAAQNLCRQYAWFATSATGVPVKAGQMGSETAPPLRVVEPLEWLLWMLGAYAGEYSQGNRLWGVSAAQDADKG